MSTRCMIHFAEADGEVTARVFRHTDGYPEEMLPDLAAFLDAVAAQSPADTRFSDATMLAARYVVWRAMDFAPDSRRPLAFLSVRVMDEDAGDAEYIYTVTCNGSWDAARKPTITHR